MGDTRGVTYTKHIRGLTLKEVGKHYTDATCRNCGAPAPIYVGCVIGPPPGTCGECEEMTDDEKVAHAKAAGISVGEPELV
jgi:hypothetical protein